MDETSTQKEKAVAKPAANGGRRASGAPDEPGGQSRGTLGWSFSEVATEDSKGRAATRDTARTTEPAAKGRDDSSKQTREGRPPRRRRRRRSRRQGARQGAEDSGTRDVVSSVDVLSEAAAYDKEVAHEKREARPSRRRRSKADVDGPGDSEPGATRDSRRPSARDARRPTGTRSTGEDTASASAGEPAGAIAFYCDLSDISRDVEQGATPPLGLLLDSVLEQGPVVVGRAYGDWGSHRHLGDDLRRRSPKAAVELVDPGVTRAGGHALRLTVDALDVCFHRPGVGTFVLVASDPALAPLVAKLREHGRRVLVCTPAEEPLLVDAADGALPWVATGGGDDEEPRPRHRPRRR